MANDSPGMLRLPGEASEETWQQQQQDGLWQRRDAVLRGGIYAVGVREVNSAPLWLPRVMERDLDGAIALHWAAQGIESSGGGNNTAHWVVLSEAERLLVATIALAPDSFEKGYLTVVPNRCELSARLYPLPADGAALWKEDGQFVVAFTRASQIVHVAALTARSLDDDAAHEMRDLMLALQMREFLKECPTLLVWTEASDDFLNAVGEYLGTTARRAERPDPVLPQAPLSLMPAEVSLIREDRKRKRRVTRWLWAAAAVYLLFFGLWIGWLIVRQSGQDRRWAVVHEHAPRVQAIRDTEQQWEALQPSINPDQYPPETFQGIVSLLPPEGIRLKEFNLDQDRLVVAGEASSVNHALKFKADLENSESLKRYHWTFPQPTVLPDNRASFRAEGSLSL